MKRVTCTLYSTWCIMICLVIPILSLLLFIQSLYSLSKLHLLVEHRLCLYEQSTSVLLSPLGSHCFITLGAHAQRGYSWFVYTLKRITCARQPAYIFHVAFLVVRRGVRRANRNAKRREERRAETVRDGSLWSFVAKVCLPVS